MITITGQSVYPGEGTVPSLYDIGWGLARTSRFAGQTKLWYPVLPHVFTVAALVSPEARFHALMHDSAETVVGDQVATWKNAMTKADERDILEMIYEELGLCYNKIPLEIQDEVHAADLAARSAEAILLGHSTPNEDFFAEIRMANVSLFQSALDNTQVYMACFSPERCIHETEWCANEFVKEVNTWLRLAKTGQEINV